MGYRSNQQVSFTSFSPYFLLFGHDPKLLASIQCAAMAILDLDETKMWGASSFVLKCNTNGYIESNNWLILVYWY